MGTAIVEQRRVPKFDPDERYAMRGGYEPHPIDDPLRKEHELDSYQNRALFLKLWTWWLEAKDAHYRSRADRLRAHEFYDNRQWTDYQIAEMEGRGQAPLVFNLVKQMVDWITGTERRTRVDWNVLPREEEDVDMATIKKELLKYVSDVNKTGWHRSAAFKDAATSGLGWLEDCVVRARNEEPCASRYQDWKCMWWDPHSRDMTFEDCRYLIRSKYVDVDYACALAPDRSEIVHLAARSNLDPGLETVEDDATISSLYMGSRSILAGSVALILGSARQRVRIFEMWYRVPVPVKKIVSNWGDDSDPLHGTDFDPQNTEHVGLLKANPNEAPLYSLTEGVTDKMKCAIFTEAGLLRVFDSPYKHGKYPFTPIWAFRDHLTGMPYGVVQPAIDPQVDYNKRRSKALFLLLNSRILYEDGTINAADEDDVLAEAARPDGRVKLRAGALKDKRFVIQEMADMASGHVRLMEEDKENIYEASGVTRENIGQQSNAISGRAILAKQQQGAVTTAELFDNYRLSIQCSGEKQLSNIEQFMAMPKVFRVIGADGKAQWMKINQLGWDAERNSVKFENDVTASSADFVVDQQDYRETVRMALSESLFEMMRTLDPTVALQLLDIAIELVDLPNKAALANRVRQINGQVAPGMEDTPEAQAAKAARDEATAADEAAQRDAIQSKTRLTYAQADKTDAETARAAIGGRREALDTAAMVDALLQVAPAADRLYDMNKPPGAAPQLQPMPARQPVPDLLPAPAPVGVE